MSFPDPSQLSDIFRDLLNGFHLNRKEKHKHHQPIITVLVYMREHTDIEIQENKISSRHSNSVLIIQC